MIIFDNLAMVGVIVFIRLGLEKFRIFTRNEIRWLDHLIPEDDEEDDEVKEKIPVNSILNEPELNFSKEFHDNQYYQSLKNQVKRKSRNKKQPRISQLITEEFLHQRQTSNSCQIFTNKKSCLY